MKKNAVNILFLSIVVLGFSLRVFNLDKNPPSVSWDEISHGFNAYSVLKTGSDEWGQKLPVINFRAYGDYPLTLNLYLTIPFIYLLGLNEFSIRLPHVFFGVLTIVATYYFAYGLTKKKSVGLLSSFLVAVEPWTVFTSRIVLQQNVSVFLITSAAAFFFNKEKNRYFLPFSLILLFLTLFAYHSTRIFSPLFLFFLIVIKRNDILALLRNYKFGFFRKLIFIASLILFFVISFIILSDPTSRARSRWLFIINESAINQIIEKRQNSRLPDYLSRIIYNRPLYFAAKFTKNYFGYLSPRFLFFKGGTQHQYSLPGHGLSFVVNLPFFYLGIWLVIRKVKTEKYLLVFVWLLLSPIAGSITSEQYAVTRASLMLPLPQLLSGLGVVYLADLIRKSNRKKPASLFVIAYLGLTLIFGFNFFRAYFRDYPKKYSESWQYGYKDAVSYVKDNYNRYDKIIVTKKYGEPHEFFLFNWPWDPKKYREDPNLIRFYQSGWFWVDRFDKFYFVNDWQIKDREDENSFILESKNYANCSADSCLLITSPGNFPKGWKKLKDINFLDGNQAFEIYENQ